MDELQRVCETVIVSIEHYDEAVYQQLKSNEWIWNETPFFKLELEHDSKIVLLESHKGKITKMISDGVSREVANGIDLPVRSDEIKAVLSALHK